MQFFNKNNYLWSYTYLDIYTRITMIKKSVLLFTTALCLLGSAQAQNRCYTDEATAEALKERPQIAEHEARLKADIERQILEMGVRKMSKTTDINDTATLYIPIVFHIVHDYESKVYITDNEVLDLLNGLNTMFNKRNADTSEVIKPFKAKIPGTNVPYIGNAKIQFRLATKDPNGQPTKGITRRLSNLSLAANDQAKYDQWPPYAYLNVWLIKEFNADYQAGVLAYAIKPATAEEFPYRDGVIGKAEGMNYDATLAHEVGHILNLDHTWGGTNSPEISCGDDDVDDTPPTKGHMGNCNAGLYDTTCVYTYNNMIGRVILNPDTNSIISGYDNNIGVSFNAHVNQIYIDSLSFYPTDSGKPYEIVLKKQGAVIGTYSGITTNNKQVVTAGKTNLNVTKSVISNNPGGIKFRIYDSIRINTVRFYSTQAGAPYEIVLKRQGQVIQTYNGITSSSGIENPVLLFKATTSDSTAEFSLEFSVNPGARKDTSTLIVGSQYEPYLPGIIRMLTPTTNGQYNFFHNWKIDAYRYEEQVKVNFFIPSSATDPNGAYSIVFSNNPGAKRDAITTGGIILDDMPDIISLSNYEDQGYYNYFYKIMPRYGYFKRYSPAMALSLFGDSTKTFIDYPDTNNTQNIMDYSGCAKMFTHLQTVRMRTALQSSMGSRSNLISPSNLALTGAMNPMQDLPPIADFTTSVSFVCGNGSSQVIFRNRSWNDTVSNLTWVITASDGSSETIPSTITNYNQTSASRAFTQPGWLNISLTAESNAGSSTIAKNDVVYIADMNAISAQGYMQEFNPGNHLDKYPIFNYFNNNHKWEVVNNIGCYDNTSIRYTGYDSRVGNELRTGSPEGDYDDFFTPAFDLSMFENATYCNLNFMTAGAFISSLSVDMNDVLEISYNTGCNTQSTSAQWQVLKNITKAQLGNNGAVPGPFAPAGPYQWILQSLEIPKAARRDRVFFRFRFKPGVGKSPLVGKGYGTGNHFYLDRIHFSDFPTGVDPRTMEQKNIALAPNPTNGSAYVMLNNITGNTIIQVTDITGKLVYRTEQNIQSKTARIEIPANHIAVSGMYLVQVISGNTKQTEKLVVQ